LSAQNTYKRTVYLIKITRSEKICSYKRQTTLMITLQEFSTKKLPNCWQTL